MPVQVMRQETVLGRQQARPRVQRQTRYFCRLCRSYGVKLRKAHLQNRHNANRDTVTKRSNDDLVDVIFVPERQPEHFSY